MTAALLQQDLLSVGHAPRTEASPSAGASPPTQVRGDNQSAAGLDFYQPGEQNHSPFTALGNGKGKPR